MPDLDAGRAWEEALLEARPILWQAARAGQKLGCYEFADQIHSIDIPGRGVRFTEFLNDICKREFGLAHGTPLLTAVVYSKHGSKLPGKGFFELGAEKYGREEIPEREWRSFWKNELGILRRYAATHPNLP